LAYQLLIGVVAVFPAIPSATTAESNDSMAPSIAIAKRAREQFDHSRKVENAGIASAAAFGGCRQ
jgi:hypothetical protein